MTHQQIIGISSVWQHHENRQFYMVTSVSKMKLEGEWKTEPLITYTKIGDSSKAFSRFRSDFLTAFTMRIS